MKHECENFNNSRELIDRASISSLSTSMGSGVAVITFARAHTRKRKVFSYIKFLKTTKEEYWRHIRQLISDLFFFASSSAPHR